MDLKRLLRDVVGDYNEAMEVISDMHDGDVTELGGKTITMKGSGDDTSIIVEKEGVFLARIWLGGRV